MEDWDSCNDTVHLYLLRCYMCEQIHNFGVCTHHTNSRPNILYVLLTKAIDYSLKRWHALIRYLEDGAIPIDNNRVENQIRPWALGRSNWLFAGSLRSGQRAANVMSLIQSAKLNGHDPYAYLKDVLLRLPTQRASQIDELLPHNWQPSVNM